jgi:DnaJ-class molecular chaperone
VKLRASSDYYSVLGLARDADAADVKRIYRALARQHHPDLPANAGDREAAVRFRLITEAYEVLSDPRQRSLYDRFGLRGLQEGFVPPDEKRRPKEHRGGGEDLETGAGTDVASIFEDLFASAAPHHGDRAAKNADLWNPANLDQGPVDEKGAGKKPRGAARGLDMGALKQGLKESIGMAGFEGDDDGESKEPSGFSIGGEFAVPDGAFGGSGDDEWVDGAPGPSGYTEPAMPRGGPKRSAEDQAGARRGPIHGDEPTASRRGAMDASWEPSVGPPKQAPPRPSQPSRGEHLHIAVPVPLLTAIHGGRHRVQVRVPGDRGDWSLESVDVAVPPGMEEGGTLRIGGRGHFPTGRGDRGDLVLTLRIAEHDYFRVEGRDIVLDVPLKPTEAAGGCRLDVPTVHGSVTVTVPPGVQSGQRIRLRGLGLPPRDGHGDSGAQVLVIHVMLPRRLARQHLEWLEKIEGEGGLDPRRGIWG